MMKVIVGLGNPGNKYLLTRHNIGFRMVDYVLEKLMLPEWKVSTKFQSMMSRGVFEDEKILLVKPQTFMNRSGEAVSKIIHFYKIPLRNLLVVHDDFDIMLGDIRLRTNAEGKSSHKGIRSIVENLGNPCFTRLRIGISNQSNIDKEAFVLQKFTREENLVIENIIQESLIKIKKWLDIKGGTE